VVGNDDFASMREVARAGTLACAMRMPMPGLVLIDGGLGQFTPPPKRWKRLE
jgi:excinuclease UvrABC nuclease subunit